MRCWAAILAALALAAPAMAAPSGIPAGDFASFAFRQRPGAPLPLAATLRRGDGQPTTLGELFGGGYLAITFDLAATGQRYQGIVPLEGDSLTHAVERYFAQSEQVPTLIRIGVRGGFGGSSPVGCWFSTWPKGKKVASACTRGPIARSGITSPRLPAR